MAKRGKVVAVSVGALALVALGASAIATQYRIREKWQLWRFENGSEDEREEAAYRLTEMKSSKAIPAFGRRLGIMPDSTLEGQKETVRLLIWIVGGRLLQEHFRRGSAHSTEELLTEFSLEVDRFLEFVASSPALSPDDQAAVTATLKLRRERQVETPR